MNWTVRNGGSAVKDEPGEATATAMPGAFGAATWALVRIRPSALMTVPDSEPW